MPSGITLVAEGSNVGFLPYEGADLPRHLESSPTGRGAVPMGMGVLLSWECNNNNNCHNNCIFLILDTVLCLAYLQPKGASLGKDPAGTL